MYINSFCLGLPGHLSDFPQVSVRLFAGPMTLFATCPINLFIGRKIPHRVNCCKAEDRDDLGRQFLLIGSGFLESYIERGFGIASGLGENG